MANDNTIHEFVQFHVDSSIKALYKDFLIILEDFRANKTVVNDNNYAYLRKRVLDSGNNCSRKIDECLDKVNFTLK